MGSRDHWLNPQTRRNFSLTFVIGIGSMVISLSQLIQKSCEDKKSLGTLAEISPKRCLYQSKTTPSPLKINVNSISLSCVFVFSKDFQFFKSFVWMFWKFEVSEGTRDIYDNAIRFQLKLVCLIKCTISTCWSMKAIRDNLIQIVGTSLAIKLTYKYILTLKLFFLIKNKFTWLQDVDPIPLYILHCWFKE